MEKTIETRVIDTLKHHPRNAALYGNKAGLYDDKLVASLKAGIWPGEIQVTTGNVIISGHRRCDHAIFAEIEQAEVWVRADLPEDPNAPEVLEALLQGNLQRNKTREQQLREFELWVEVEKEQSKGRKASLNGKSARGGIHHEQKTGKARDLAAERVGFKSGSDAEKALKALKAADAAEATRDAEQVEKAKLVKQELNKSLGGAVRVAREQGLIAGPKPRGKANAAPVEAVTAEPAELPAAAEPPAPAEIEPVPVAAKPQPVSAELRKLHNAQGKWIKERWLPAAQKVLEASQPLAEARLLLRAEGTRLGNLWRHREVGGKIFTIPYQRLAAEWEQKGYLSELAAALGSEDQSLDGVLLKLEHTSKACASMANAMRMFTGCRPDNNFHE